MELVVKTLDGTPVTHDVTENAVRMFGPDGVPVEFVLRDSESGSGGSSENVSVIADPEWINDVCFWDYDGTLVHRLTVEQAAAVTELPSPPAHDGLTFLGWNYTLEQVQATTYPLDVGAMYIPSDGNTHLHLSITNASYLAVPVNWSQTVSGGVSIDWGDGTAATTVSGTGAVTTTHTYAAIGEYDVTITVAGGCTMTLGGGTAKTVFVGSNISTYKNYLTELYIGPGVELSDYSVRSCSLMTALTIPDTIHAIPADVLTGFDRLPVLAIPSSVSVIGASSCSSLGSRTPRLACQILSLPESVTELGSSVLHSSDGLLRLSIPKGITALPDYSVCYMHRIRRVFLPDGIVSIGGHNFNGCYHLERLDLPDGIEEIPQYSVYDLRCLKKLTLPRGLKRTSGYYPVKDLGIEDLYVPQTIESLGDYSMTGDFPALRRVVYGGLVIPQINTKSYGLTEMIYLSEVVPDTVYTGTNYTEIYVPDAAYEDYVAKFGEAYRFRVHPLSEYPGELPTYE